jgi:hypothetical protein
MVPIKHPSSIAFIMTANLVFYLIGFDGGGEDLISCNNVTKDHVSYCCDHGIANCCDSGDGRFDVLPYPTSLIATWNPAASRFSPLHSSSTSTTTSHSSPASLISTTSATTTMASLMTSSAPTTPEASSSAVPDSLSNGPGLSKGAQVGIGLGVVGGVLLAALLAYLIWRVHKTYNAVKQQQELNPHPYPLSTIAADKGPLPSYAQSYQYQTPTFSPATPSQLVTDLETSYKARASELPTNSS